MSISLERKICRSKLAFGGESTCKSKDIYPLKKLKSINWSQNWNNFQIAEMAGFRGQRSGSLTSVEVKNGLFGFVSLFWLNSLDQPPFQPQIWPPTSSKAKKRSVFAVFMAMMATTYMLLEIFSFEQIKILNGKKHLQYDRLTHHKVWGSSSNFSFLSFHTNIYTISKMLLYLHKNK